MHRNNSKSIKNLGVKIKSIKTFKRHITARCCDFSLGKKFSFQKFERGTPILCQFPGAARTN